MPPKTKLTPEQAIIPRALAEQTVAILVQLPTNQVYGLIRQWEEAVPNMIKWGAPEAGEPA